MVDLIVLFAAGMNGWHCR